MIVLSNYFWNKFWAHNEEKNRLIHIHQNVKNFSKVFVLTTITRPISTVNSNELSIVFSLTHRNSANKADLKQGSLNSCSVKKNVWIFLVWQELSLEFIQIPDPNVAMSLTIALLQIEHCLGASRTSYIFLACSFPNA